MPKPKNRMIQDSEEFSKMKGDMGPEYEGVPREQPSAQTPGGKGYRRPNLEEWTDEELRKILRDLGVKNVDQMDRTTLLEHLESEESLDGVRDKP